MPGARVMESGIHYAESLLCILKLTFGGAIDGSGQPTMTHMIASPPLDTRELVERAEARAITPELAARLIRSTGTGLVSLMAAASALRDRHKGTRVTYSRKVFIPLTNLCRDACGYCTFAKAP